MASLTESSTCRMCMYNTCDLQLGCGCSFHARCLPLGIVLMGQQQQIGGTLSTTTFGCQFCGTSSTNPTNKPTIFIAPLDYQGLEQSIALRQESSSLQSKHEVQETNDDATTSSNNTVTSSSNNHNYKQSNKRSREDAIASDEAIYHATYVVYCQGRRQGGVSGTTSTSSVLDDELHRTGRWNDQEVQYVDQLVNLFDQGLLPISNNTKLSSFLGDMLLSKASRLTKKMKNAKLSSRSYTMAQNVANTPHLFLLARSQEDCRMLSALQEQFIQSLPSLSAQLEMRFNLQKHWRNYFSNWCVALEYPHLEVSAFLGSLEEQEVRAAQAEAQMRNVRRRRLGLGGASGLSSVARPLSPGSLATANTVSSNDAMQTISAAAATANANEKDDIEQDLENIMNMDDFPGSKVGNGYDNSNDDEMVTTVEQSLIPKPDAIGEDFDRAMKFLMGPANFNFFSGVTPRPLSDICDWSTASNPFLAAISMYLEERNLPFQYVDCWVPSISGNGPGDKEGDVRLLPAGFITRDDQDEDLTSALMAFGEYSKSFSFKPGRGLPGRVYLSGKSAWQNSLNEVHPSIFARAGGAKAYGLRTAAAIPFSTPGVGRMVVVMYSTEHIPKDEGLTKLCSEELAKFEPQPKWKLVIEIGAGQGTTGLDNIENLNEARVDPRLSSHGDISAMVTPRNERVAFSYQQQQVLSSGHVDSSTSSSFESVSEEEIERRLISVLGSQMPSTLTSESGESSSSMASELSELLPEIMRMRLLLLRPFTRRSQEENDIVDVLKSSFRNYSEESKRSDGDIALLLAREWQCLKSFAPSSPSVRPLQLSAAGTLEVNKLATTAVTTATNDGGVYQSQMLDVPRHLAVGQVSMCKALNRPSFVFKPVDDGPAVPHTMDSYDHRVTRSVSAGDPHFTV